MNLVFVSDRAFTLRNICNTTIKDEHEAHPSIQYLLLALITFEQLNILTCTSKGIFHLQYIYNGNILNIDNQKHGLKTL
jgi:hypothetical protein